MKETPLSVATMAAAIVLMASTQGQAQVVFVCEGEGRSFVVAGEGGAPPGCREVADPSRELSLAPAQPDLTAMSRELASLAARVQRLEALLGRPASRSSPLSPSRRIDPSDTRDRTRELGRDIERRLDELRR